MRCVPLKDFFGEKHLRDIKPMVIERFKRERLATPTVHDKPEGPKPRSPASVNRDLACLSKILSMAFDNELIDSNPMRRVRLLKESGSRERFITSDEEEIHQKLSEYAAPYRAGGIEALRTEVGLEERSRVGASFFVRLASGTTPLSTFGTPTGFAAPRQVRFSLDFEF